MLRDRTTTSWLMMVVSPLMCVVVVEAAGAQPAPRPVAPPAFPSDPIWTVDVPAKPVASPVAAGDRLFLALESGISARKLADGTEIWHKKIAVDGAMAASADRLVVPSKGEVSGLAAATGDVVWTERIGPLTAPPVLHGDSLLLAAGGHLAVHRAADGGRTWTRDVGIVEQRPTVSGGRIYVPVSDGKLLALDLVSGEPVWEKDVGIKPTEPLVHGDRVFFGTAAKKFCSFRLRDGEMNWCAPVGATVIGGTVTDGERVYFVALDNLLRAFDRGHGAQRWRKDLQYRPSAGPSLVGKTVSAPGREARLQSYDTVTGAQGGQLTLPAPMAEVPVFIAVGGGSTKVAALAGGLESAWKLVLAGPPPLPLPELKIEPPTELPGRVVRVGALSVPRE